MSSKFLACLAILSLLGMVACEGGVTNAEVDADCFSVTAGGGAVNCDFFGSPSSLSINEICAEVKGDCAAFDSVQFKATLTPNSGAPTINLAQPVNLTNTKTAKIATGGVTTGFQTSGKVEIFIAISHGGEVQYGGETITFQV